MKKMKIATLRKAVAEGRIECVTDMKLGYVDIIRYTANGNRRKRETILVVA